MSEPTNPAAEAGARQGAVMTHRPISEETRLELLQRVSNDLGWHTDSRGRDIVEVEIEILLDWIIDDRLRQTPQSPAPVGEEPVPPEGCTCASFWTVRQAHKRDCPLAHPVDGRLVGKLDFYRRMYGVEDPDFVSEMFAVFAAHLQAAVREARLDELQRIAQNTTIENRAGYVADRLLELRKGLRHLKQEGKTNELKSPQCISPGCNSTVPLWNQFCGAHGDYSHAMQQEGKTNGR